MNPTLSLGSAEGFLEVSAHLLKLFCRVDLLRFKRVLHFYGKTVTPKENRYGNFCGSTNKMEKFSC